MREIKFRGMDSNGDWHYGLVGYKSTTLLPGGKTGWFISDIDGSPWAYQVRPETIGQYTGLKDSAGKEIYEGDIIELCRGKSNIHQRTGKRFEVKFLTHRFCGFGFGYVRCPAVDMALTESKAKICRVIGNIHENPELLEDNNVH